MDSVSSSTIRPVLYLPLDSEEYLIEKEDCSICSDPLIKDKEEGKEAEGKEISGSSASAQTAVDLTVVVTKCNHLFHKTCLDEVLSQSKTYAYLKNCSICRRTLEPLDGIPEKRKKIPVSNSANLAAMPQAAEPSETSTEVLAVSLASKPAIETTALQEAIKENLFNRFKRQAFPLVLRAQQLQYEINLEHVIAGALSTIPYIAINTIFNGLKFERIARQFLVSSLQGSFFAFITIDDTINTAGIADPGIIVGGLQLGGNILGLVVDGISNAATVSVQVSKAALWIFTGAYFAGEDIEIEKIPRKLAVLTFLATGYEFAWGQDFQTAVVRALGHAAAFFVGAVSCHAIRLIAKTTPSLYQKAKVYVRAGCLNVCNSSIARKISRYVPQVLAVAMGAAALIGCNALLTWEKVNNWMPQAIIGGVWGCLHMNVLWYQPATEDAFTSSIALGFFYTGFKAIGFAIEGFSYITTVSTQVTKASSFIFYGMLGEKNRQKSKDDRNTVIFRVFLISASYEYLQCEELKPAISSAFNNIAMIIAGVAAYRIFYWIKKTSRLRVTRQFI